MSGRVPSYVALPTIAADGSWDDPFEYGLGETGAGDGATPYAGESVSLVK
jgi:hypothetical protein